MVDRGFHERAERLDSRLDEDEVRLTDVKRELNRHRRDIAGLLFFTYAAAILTILSAHAYVGYWNIFGEVDPDELARWEVISTSMKEVVQNSILPIATFVLGFYFGQEKSSE